MTDAEVEVVRELVSATLTQNETGPAGAGWEWGHSDEEESVVD